MNLRASDLLQDKIQKVSTFKYWKGLIHFHGGFFKTESLADSESFFLAKNGKYDLAKELAANIKAFKSIENTYTPQKIPAQCAFPERFNFIKKNFPEIAFKKPKCPHFERWKSAVVGESLSLVFASSFVNNPSSMFGHTFLKFNKKGNESLSKDMFNYVVAFSAKADDKPGLLYAIKGLFGGYKGIVDVQPFYQTLREYSKVESRDIWDYKLSLTNPQIDALVNHIWELYANANFDYYFFDENCTSVLVRILSLVTNIDLDKKMSGYSLPTDFLRVLADSHLVEKTSYHPSLRKQFFATYNSLSNLQRDSFSKILNKESEVGDRETLSSLVHYYDYIRHDHENKVSSEFQQAQKRILSLSSKKGKSKEVTAKTPSAPEEGHLPGRIDLMYGKEGSSKTSILTFRPTFHALIDPSEGYEPWSHIELFKLSAKFNHSQKDLVLNEFLFAEIQSLPDFKFLDTNTSWSLDLRAAPLYEEGKINSYKGSFNLDMGLSKHSEYFLFSILTGARIEGHSSFKNKLKVGPNVKINIGVNLFQTKLILESSYFYSLLESKEKIHRDYLQTKLQLSSSLSKRISLKFEGSHFSDIKNISNESYQSYVFGVGLYY